jgi:hypothetical protein
MQKLRQIPTTPVVRSTHASSALYASARRTHQAAWAHSPDLVISFALSLLTFSLYIATLLPGIGNRDTAELQRITSTLGLAHPTGYPLYTLLGWLWCQLPLGGTPAWRMNVFSAATAALAIGLVYLAARALGQRHMIAAAAAATLAVSHTFWAQATIAEVYTLAAMFQAALILALLLWRAGRLPFWTIGLMIGFGLAHHRSIVLLLPGVLLFLMFGRRPHLREAGAALLALLPPCLLYLYLPLRAPFGSDPWRLLWEYAIGADMTAAWLDPQRLLNDGHARLLDLARRFVWPQLLPAGALLALLGAARLLRRDLAASGLLLAGYGTVTLFCAAYYVDDIEVFFIPAHLLAALLLGEGVMLIGHLMLEARGSRAAVDGKFIRSWRSVGVVWLLPALLLLGNLGAIRAASRPTDELAARALMAEPLPQGAWVIGDWSSIEGPRYLQAVEGLRPDLQLGIVAQREPILDALAHGQAVYLLKPTPELGLTQRPAGQLWRVNDRPLTAETPTFIRWNDGIALSGYTLPHSIYRPGEVVPIALAWRATDAPQQPYILFIHLIGPDGGIWGQVDRPPAGAPTDRWSSSEHMLDLYTPQLNPSAPPGRYRVTIGWYTYPSLERLPLADQPVDHIVLGELDVGEARPASR